MAACPNQRELGATYHPLNLHCKGSMRKMHLLGLGFAAAMLSALPALAADWVDLTAPATITQKDCEAGFKAPYETFVTEAQWSAGMRPARNEMSCWGLHVSNNQIFDACMDFRPEVNQRCEFWHGYVGYLPLEVAVSHLNEHAMQVLLARGANAGEGQQLVHKLSSSCATNVDQFAVCKRMLGELVRHGAGIDDRKRANGLRDDLTPFLSFAFWSTSKQWLDALLELGADVNAKDEYSCTALDRAERSFDIGLHKGGEGGPEQSKSNLPAFLKARGGKNSLMCPLRRGLEALPWVLCVFGGCNTH